MKMETVTAVQIRYVASLTMGKETSSRKKKDRVEKGQQIET
jgi:hypothetical protein